MINIDLENIKIVENNKKKSILDKMAEQYAGKIKDKIKKKLKSKLCSDPKNLEYIYTILDQKGAENILKYNLKQMKCFIDELNKTWNLWSTFSSPGCGIKKEDGTPYVSCGDCALIKGTGKWKGKKKKCKQYDILKDLQKIFDYNNWCSDKKIDFKPYDFIKLLNVKACPYCNLEYVQVATFKRKIAPAGEDKYVRPDLDHFYPKSKYPFFALCLYNLVPSCKTCNSSIKHEDDSLKSYKKIIHPYDEEKINYCDCIKYIFTEIPQGAFEKYLKVYGKIPQNKFLEEYGKYLRKGRNKLGISLQDETMISIKYIPGRLSYSSQDKSGRKKIIGITKKDREEYKRAKTMFEYFAIGPRAEQGHNDYIKEIAAKAIEYSEDYIRYLKCKGYYMSEALRLFFGNYVEPKDFNLRPLSKITHDVIEQIRPDILKMLEENQS